MDIKNVMQEIATIEREKAQAELLAQQLKEQKVELEKKMSEAGVTADNIDDKIAELESSIQEQLSLIRSAPAEKTPAVAIKAAPVKAVKSDSLGVLDI